MTNKSPGINYVLGKLSSTIFNRGLLDDGISPFALIMISIVRRVLEPNCSTWNNPAHLSNVYSDLGSPTKPSPYSITSCVMNGLKYVDSGDLDFGGEMTTHAPFSFPVNKSFYLLS